MASTSTSASPPPFTFASPVSFSSETHEDALNFDYESWIQQSKLANCYSNKQLWMDDAEAEVINRNRYHHEMMLRVADNLPEEAYELSLRDITELSLPPPPPPPPPPRATPTSSLPCRHKHTPSISMEGAGSFIIKLFMPLPSRAAASSSGGGRRNRSFSSSSMTVSTKRKPMSCYPFFNSSKYKAKHKFTGNQ